MKRVYKHAMLQEVKFLKDQYPTKDAKELAAILGRDQQAVEAMIRRYKIKKT